MEERRQSVEALVGILVIVGLCAIGFLVIKFGKIGERFQDYYDLTIELNDATGIREGVPVRLGGVMIGHVSEIPRLKADFSAMEVPLEIRVGVRIPRDSRVTIGSAGLMGDSYVKFSLPESPSDGYIEPGTALQAGPSFGLKALQDDAGGALNSVSESVADLNRAIESLDRIFGKVEGMLEDNDTGNLKGAISDLSEMATTVNEAARKLDPLIGSADEVIKDFQETAKVLRDSTGKLDPLFSSAEDTFSKVRDAAASAEKVIGTAGGALETGNGAIRDIATAIEKANPTLEELSSVIQSFRETLARVDHFAAEAENNDGLLKALRDDPELKRDFTELIDKLETNGIIFYPRERERNSILSPRGTRRN